MLRLRNRVEITRDMVARTVARSRLARLTRNSVVYHVLAAAASELAEVHFQIGRLRKLFSLDGATGSDLDERAREVVPARISRRLAVTAQGGAVVFSRVGIVGTLTIPAGQIVGAPDSEGVVRYRTAAATTIGVGDTASPPVTVIALEAGDRGNVAAGAISRLLPPPAGVAAVTNTVAIENGAERERDDDFRARIKRWIQSLSRATPLSIETYARAVQLANGQRVLFAKLIEPAIPTGTMELLVDDGTGTAGTFSEVFITGTDVLLDPAIGGELDVYTTARPIWDDGSFVVRVNAVDLVRGVDYRLNPTKGQVELVTPLAPGDVVTAQYRYHTGLLAQVARVIEGDPSNPSAYPGVRGGGTLVLVGTPQVVFQQVVARISVAGDYNVDTVSGAVATALQRYINGLDIGEPVILAEIIERAMGVEGMVNFIPSNLSGSTPPVDQTLNVRQVARVVAADITLV